jgi:hypothetical protein
MNNPLTHCIERVNAHQPLNSTLNTTFSQKQLRWEKIRWEEKRLLTLNDKRSSHTWNREEYSAGTKMVISQRFRGAVIYYNRALNESPFHLPTQPATMISSILSLYYFVSYLHATSMTQPWCIYKHHEKKAWTFPLD